MSVNQLVEETGSSFPSKHATISFLLATFVFLLNKKLGFLFLVFAVLVSTGRVFVGVHYPSDILVGAIFGILIGFLFFRKKYFTTYL
jgi:undecaprenyl-diphosphatase